MKNYYIRGFIAWIVFACFPNSLWQWGATAAAVVALRLLMQDRRSGVAADALVLEGSTIVYFALLAVIAFADPHSPLRNYSGATSFGWLALTAFGSLAVRHPFTLGIARRTTPREYWDTPVFRRVNTVITTVWATCFAVTAGAIAACEAAHTGEAAKLACEVVGFVIPAGFTRVYPKMVQARATAAAGSPVV